MTDILKLVERIAVSLERIASILARVANTLEQDPNWKNVQK